MYLITLDLLNCLADVLSISDVLNTVKMSAYASSSAVMNLDRREHKRGSAVFVSKDLHIGEVASVPDVNTAAALSYYCFVGYYVGCT